MQMQLELNKSTRTSLDNANEFLITLGVNSMIEIVPNTAHHDKLQNIAPQLLNQVYHKCQLEDTLLPNFLNVFVVLIL